MPKTKATSDDVEFMKLAFEEALAGFEEGGVPVGSALVADGRVLARGRNKRVQEGDPIAHGEMDCLRAAGRRPHYRNTTLYTTLSPCMMCTGAILQFGIPRVVVGENRNFEGNIAFLSERGVEVVLMDDPACIDLMARFVRERPELWTEDIAEDG
ncbi:MAG: nucleoside deaminase [Rhodospirillales bacterium]|nr:nucleoside deaminase [Rhodospirillales bacterium]MDH3913854.1 nucleoside deaminase [Rhodospirillales bacterium]MDH3917640.1 nucleoside deaminase [Rhodospirillales bacterium]MDH3967940.1 nucleoside deaminase [Rhodospirillales bacterium]